MSEIRYHTDSCPKTIVNEWYERGQREKEAMFKFISYWIVLNQLYNYGVEDLEEVAETARIRNYIREHGRVLYDVIDFNAPYMEEFKSRPVIVGPDQMDHSIWKGDEDQVAKELFRLTARRSADRQRQYAKCSYIARDFVNISDPDARKSWRITALFMTVYRVRCNLFHGMKRPSGERDYRLVRDSAKVLEVCLPVLIPETFRRR